MKAISNAYLLAIDQGTTGSRAFIYDAKGNVVRSSYREFRQYYPKPGWVEHDAEEIWNSVVAVINDAVKGLDRTLIKAIGITNQRETTVVWDQQTGKPLYPAIVWQDRRTSDDCASARLKAHVAYIKKITGLKLDPYFSATKLAWALTHVPSIARKVKEGSARFGTIDSWLLFKLTGGVTHATDMTNASRTMLFDIRRKCWDQKLLKIFKIPPSILPKVLQSGAHFGSTQAVAGLPEGIPICAMIGDQQAALYGQGCFETGSVKNTYGTGCFMVMNTGTHLRVSNTGLLTTIASDVHGQPIYALEGSVFVAGAAVQWLRDGLKAIKRSSETSERIAATKDNGGVYFVPAFVGLGAPYWRPEARGIICGLTRGTTKEHIIRAAVEAMAYQTKDVFDLMQKDSGIRIKELRVDGGACENNFLMQFQADLLHIRVERPQKRDSTAWGAAQLAGITLGLWKPSDLKSMQAADRVFIPTITNKKAEMLYRGWQAAVERAL